MSKKDVSGEIIPPDKPGSQVQVPHSWRRVAGRKPNVTTQVVAEVQRIPPPSARRQQTAQQGAGHSPAAMAGDEFVY
ncbi:hypothetical protein MN188_17095 [Aliiroseovarius sp. N1Y82]|nr:hypothetical protein [Aliiroseovarius subalbicans]